MTCFVRISDYTRTVLVMGAQISMETGLECVVGAVPLGGHLFHDATPVVKDNS